MARKEKGEEAVSCSDAAAAATEEGLACSTAKIQASRKALTHNEAGKWRQLHFPLLVNRKKGLRCQLSRGCYLQLVVEHTRTHMGASS